MNSNNSFKNLEQRMQLTKAFVVSKLLHQCLQTSQSKETPLDLSKV